MAAKRIIALDLISEFSGLYLEADKSGLAESAKVSLDALITHITEQALAGVDLSELEDKTSQLTATGTLPASAVTVSAYSTTAEALFSTLVNKAQYLSAGGLMSAQYVQRYDLSETVEATLVRYEADLTTLQNQTSQLGSNGYPLSAENWRDNLELGSAALKDIGVTAGRVVVVQSTGFISKTILPPTLETHRWMYRTDLWDDLQAYLDWMEANSTNLENTGTGDIIVAIDGSGGYGNMVVVGKYIYAKVTSELEPAAFYDEQNWHGDSIEDIDWLNVNNIPEILLQLAENESQQPTHRGVRIIREGEESVSESKTNNFVGVNNFANTTNFGVINVGGEAAFSAYVGFAAAVGFTSSVDFAGLVTLQGVDGEEGQVIMRAENGTLVWGDLSSAGGVMLVADYDPQGIGLDAFALSSMTGTSDDIAEGDAHKFLTGNELTAGGDNVITGSLTVQSLFSASPTGIDWNPALPFLIDGLTGYGKVLGINSSTGGLEFVDATGGGTELDSDIVDALNASVSSPSVTNAFATLADVANAGGGDMLVATYDPNEVAGDAFDMDNMVEGATNLILTVAERTLIANAIQNSGEQSIDGDISILATLTVGDELTAQNGLQISSTSAFALDNAAPTGDAVMVISSTNAYPSYKAISDFTQLTTDQLAAITGAASPSATNVFATMADIPDDADGITEGATHLFLTVAERSSIASALQSVSEADVTQHQAALSITQSQISDLAFNADIVRYLSDADTILTTSIAEQYHQRATTYSSITIGCDYGTSPGTSAITVDVYKDGTSLTTLTLAVGSSENTVAFAYSFAVGERLRFDVTQADDGTATGVFIQVKGTTNG